MMDEQIYNRMSEWVAIAEDYTNDAITRNQRIVGIPPAFMIGGLALLRQLLADNPPDTGGMNEQGEGATDDTGDVA